MVNAKVVYAKMWFVVARLMLNCEQFDSFRRQAIAKVYLIRVELTWLLKHKRLDQVLEIQQMCSVKKNN